MPAGSLPPLDDEELRLYARQWALPEVGAEGQARLREARVLVVGVGGLGSPCALYLAAAGVGTLGLVDFDRVDASNLHRQILFGAGDVGRNKLDVAAQRLRAAHPRVRVETYAGPLASGNALEVVGAFDLVADGTDNFPTRYLVNDACVLTHRANVYASVYRFEGQASVFGVPGGPCYRCLYPEPPPPDAVPSCADAGVLGVLPGMLGLIQATEAIKRILRIGEPLVGRLLQIDALTMRVRETRIVRDPGCAVCGDSPTITGPIDYEAFCGVSSAAMVSSAPMQASPAEVSVEELQAMRERGEAFVLLDVREPREWEISDLADSIKIPLGTLPENLEKLSKTDTIVAYCRSGGRSGNAVQFLHRMGFGGAKNLVGGINRWAERIDPRLPRY